MDTDRYVIDAFSAEQLARSYEAFGPVEIREALEGELVPDAMRLLAHFSGKAEPSHELRHWSLTHGIGYYRDREDRPSADDEYRSYLRYLKVKDAEHHAKTGGWMPASRREDLTREFYAPAYRAEMSKLSAAAYKDFRDLGDLDDDDGEEEEEEVA